MVSVGNEDRAVMHVSSGRGRGLTQVGSASKFLREMRAVLLLAPDWELGVRGVDGEQGAVCVARGVKSLVGATGDAVALLLHHSS
jgi:hypothetical protein